MREKYEALQMEIIIFHTEDVITGSGGDDDICPESDVHRRCDPKSVQISTVDYAADLFRDRNIQFIPRSGTVLQRDGYVFDPLEKFSRSELVSGIAVLIVYNGAEIVEAIKVMLLFIRQVIIHSTFCAEVSGADVSSVGADCVSSGGS